MKKKLYYIAPFIVIPLSVMIYDLLNSIGILEASHFGLIAMCLIISAVIGFLSSTRKTFDYLMTAIVPFSMFCFAFLLGFLEKSDLETRFHLSQAVSIAFPPDFLRIYLLMIIVTFLASFKYFRNIKKYISK